MTEVRNSSVQMVCSCLATDDIGQNYVNIKMVVSTTRSGLKMQLHWRKSLSSWTPMVLPVVPSGNLEWKILYLGYHYQIYQLVFENDPETQIQVQPSIDSYLHSL